MTGDEKRWNSFPGDRVIRRIVSLKRGSRVLDVGSGTSEILFALPLDISYVGLESCAWAVDGAKKKWASRVSASFLLHDQDEFSFGDESFDAILLFYSLEHFKKPREILVECKRVLRGGGVLIVAAPNLEFPFAYPNALRHRSTRYRIYLFFIRLFDYLKRIFGIYSFRILRENFTSKTGKYEKKDDDLWHIVSSWEVIKYLEGRGFSLEYFWEERPLESWRKIIRWLPTMKWYGVPLAAVFKKVP